MESIQVEQSKSIIIDFFGEDMIDGHVHLEKGPLTKEYVYEFIDEAIRKNIGELQILDHTHRFKEFGPIYEKYKINEAQINWLNSDLRNSIYEYIELVEEMKKETLPIKVTFGLEVCYQSEEEKSIKELIKDIYNWDFLVGSVHAIDYIVYDSAWSIKELWDKYDTDYIYSRYYKTMFDLIKSNLFSQLAHPDTIKMFNYYPTYDLTDTYHELANELSMHHMKVENNVGCYYRYHHSDMGLSDELLDIFKQHKCSLITASDAHYPKDVGNYIKEVCDKTMK